MENCYPTLKDVAKLAETSIATVSYVLNGNTDRYIKRALREKVLYAAKSLNYTKSLVASGLKGKSRKMLTIIVPQILNGFFAHVVNGILEKSSAKGYFLNICSTLDSAKRESETIEQAISQRVDGFFVSGSADAHRNLSPVVEHGVPFVVIERPLSKEWSGGYNYVGSDNIQAGRIAGEYLAENGHSRIGYIEWMRNIENVRNRRKGFELAMSPTLAKGGSCVIKSSQALSAENGYQMTEEILKSAEFGRERPTAFLYGHHRLAEGGVACLKNYGLRIPDKVSVMIIGSTEWARLSIPQFSFVRQPIEKITTIACNLLIDLVEGKKDPHSVETHILECELVEGGTVKNLWKES
jgi:DNA-binding LacI/PurR family transcriptional regulator